MKLLALLILPLLSLAAVAGTSARPDWNDAGIDWKSYADGMAEAGESGRPALLLFYSDWCPTCRAYGQLFRDPGVAGLAQELVMIRVNVVEEPALALRFSEEGNYLPRTYALGGDGEVWREMATGHPAFPRFIEPDDSESLRRLMRRVLARWLAEDAAVPAMGH